MLRADELARIRAVNASWLNQTATITRHDVAEQTTDGFPSTSSDTIASSVPCRAEPVTRGAGERIVGEGVTSSAEWNIILEHDTPQILPRDVITVTDVGVFDVATATTERGVQTDVVARCVRRDA